jgi:serine/threonine protein kinase/tetratricopeptide (TPR) repeat protein
MVAPPACPACGEGLPPTAQFCPGCGRAVRPLKVLGESSDIGPRTDQPLTAVAPEKKEVTETQTDIGEISQFLPQRYKPVRKIGQGGMGTVYQCLDQALERQVAIKIMTDRYRSDPQGERRFMREARAQAIVNHPNVATVLNFGVSPEGRLYLVMEYLEGQDLRSMIRQEKVIEPLKACELLKQSCEGLDEAHAGGLVHRDLKPSNLMIVKDHRGQPWVKILDLGLAKIVGGQTDLKSITVDTAGLLIGTPAYMSPEQVAGATVDGRADIYSLGVVFFEMLTGHLPFESETMEGWLYQHLNTKPPAPTKIAPALARFPQLDQIVLWMLSKQPHERPKTAGELALMLKRMIEKKLIEENPPKTAKKSGPRVALAFEDNPPARGSGPRPSLLIINDGPPPPPDGGAQPAPPPPVPAEPGTDMLKRRRLEYGDLCKEAEKAESERNWETALQSWERAAQLAEDPGAARGRAENCRREIAMQSQLAVVQEAVSTGNWEKAEHLLIRLAAVRNNDPRVEQIRARLPKRLIQAWLNLAHHRIVKLPEGDLRHALMERLGLAHAQSGNMQEAVTILHAASHKMEQRVIGMSQAIVEAVHYHHLEGLRPWLDTVNSAASGLADPAERGRAHLELGLAYSAYGDHSSAGQAFRSALSAYNEANAKGIPMHAVSKKTTTGVLKRPSADLIRSVAFTTTANLTTTSIGGPKSVKASWEAAVGVIAQSQADAGLVEDSLASAALIEDPWTLAHSLSQVAQALAKTGRSVEAERVAGQITFSLPKMQALRALAVARIYRGDLNGAEETYKTIATPADRIYLQGLLATAWALRNDKGRAEFRVNEIIKGINDVVGARARFQALLSAIEPLLNASFHEIASKLVAEASRLADLIDDPAERLRGLLQMAMIQENARGARFSATRTMAFSNQPDSSMAEVLRRALVMWRQVRSGPDRFDCGERLAYNVANASMPVLASELLSACKDDAETAVVYIGLSSGVS